MNIRPKEKVTAVFRRLFKSSHNKDEGPSKPSGSAQGSPARRLLRSNFQIVSLSEICKRK